MKTTLLRVMLIAGILAFSDDVWADDLYLSGALDGTYYSSDGIVAEGTAPVETGRDVALFAIDRIELRSGFRVNAGGTFRASLENDANTDGDSLLDWWELHFLGSLQWGPNDSSTEGRNLKIRATCRIKISRLSSRNDITTQPRKQEPSFFS